MNPANQGLQFVQPSHDHGRRTIELPTRADSALWVDGQYAQEVWALASKSLLLHVQSSLENVASNVLIFDLGQSDPDPKDGTPPLILIPGLAPGGCVFLSEPQVERRPSGFPFDRGFRVYVQAQTTYAPPNTESAILVKITARVKVSRCPVQCASCLAEEE